MVGGYRLRQVDPHNPLLEDLHRRTLPNDEFPRWGDSTWWLCWCDGEAVGFCGVRLRYSMAYLIRAGVLHAHRGQGLQRRMIRVRERAAKREGYHWVYSTTYMNPASSNSLIRHGYRQYWPNEPWGADGTAYWQKEI